MDGLIRVPVTGRATGCPEGCRGLHTYPDPGERWCWRPHGPGRFAVDAERADVPPPPRLRRLMHDDSAEGLGFWRAWTRLEAIAKLTGTPAHLLVSRHGLDVPAPEGVRLRHVRYGETICCFAEET